MTVGGREIPGWTLVAAPLGVAAILAAVLLAGGERWASTYLATAGFGAVGAACLGAGLRASAGFAIAFAVYGGLSALVAVSNAEVAVDQFDPGLVDLEGLGVVTSYLHPPGPGDGSFAYAMAVTCAGGLAAVIAAAVGPLRSRGAPKRRASAKDGRDATFAERAGRILVGIGFIGFVLAAGRFAVSGDPGATIWDSLKDLWTGGSYTLLIASFAVPGIGLWLHGLLSRTHRVREIAFFAATLAFFGLLSIGTGQRGFLIQLTLVCLVVAAFHIRIRPWQVAALAAVSVVLLGVTQAIRNSIRETGTVGAGDLVSRLEPDRWRVLMGSQLASFAYTWDVAYNRDSLDIPNTFVALVQKPVPRQLMPDKVQGFGDEFTADLYPYAHDQQISFATPLVAESEYSFGLPGVLVILALVGALAGLVEARMLSRAPPALLPVLAAALIWVCFVLIRGDLANALFVSAGWVLPLAAVCAAIGFVPLRESGGMRTAGGYARGFFEGAHRRAAPAAEAAGDWLVAELRLARAKSVIKPLPSTAVLIVLGALLTAAVVMAMYLSRDLTFFRDEWLFLQYRDGHNLENFISSYGGNLLPWLTALFVVLFKTVGLDHYSVFRLIVVLGHLACVVSLYALCRRRIGDVAALAPAIVVLFLGAGWFNLLFPIQIGFTAALTCGLLALLLLERDDRLGDAGACALLVAGIGWAAPSLAFIPAVAVGLFVRGRLWSRIWVVAVPAVLYLAWTIAYQDSVGISYGENLPKMPDYIAEMAGAALTAPTGLPGDLGPPLAIALVAGAVYLLFRRGRSAVLGWEGLALVVTLVVLTALARATAEAPDASRYVYSTVVFGLVLAVGLMPARPPGRRVTAALLVGAALTVIPGIPYFEDGRERLVKASTVSGAKLGALEVAREDVSPEFFTYVGEGFSIRIDPYFAAVDRYGSSPAYDPDRIAGLGEHTRREADGALAGGLGLRVKRASGDVAPGGPPPAVAGRRDSVTEGGSCLRVGGPAPGVSVEVPPEGALLRPAPEGELEVGLRRFADGFTSVPALGAGERGILRPPRDSEPERPWYARIESAQPFSVCGISRRGLGGGDLG